MSRGIIKDFNTARNIGTYSYDGDGGSNLPTTWYGLLTVYKSPYNYLVQNFYSGNGKRYVRLSPDNGVTWQAWDAAIQNSDLALKYCNNLDSLSLTEGRYFTNTSTAGTFPAGFHQAGIFTLTNRSSMMFVKYTDQYGRQADRVYVDGSWTNWAIKTLSSDLKAGYLQVQFETAGDVTSTVTFSTPLSTADYAVCITVQDNSGDLTVYNNLPIIISKRTDGFTFKASRSKAGTIPFVWIATPYK